MEELESVRVRAEAFLTDVSREYHAAHAGLKAGAELQPIYARHRDAFGDESYATVRDAYDRTRPSPSTGRGTASGAPRSGATGGTKAGSDDEVSARLLLDWIVDARVGEALAPLEEREIAWESAARITLSDGTVEPYQRASITIANTRDARERRALDDARAALVQSDFAPLRQERFARERDLWEALGIAPSYNATFEALSGVSLAKLAAACEAFLRDTQSMWDDVLPEALRAGLGINANEATRADALALMRAPQFDGYFPASDMERSVRRQMLEMGMNPDADGRVRYDTGERAGKRARAFCAPVRIPDEVHLVLRPHGGQNDWQTLMHELGHALHFAQMDAALPFEYRWLGDNAITEAYAMLFDHRLQDTGWLLRYSSLDKAALPAYRRAAGFEELQFLRRYCAKFIYEVQLYSGTVAWAALPDLYVETLTRATGFRYQRADAFVDVDPRFYSARYLRAWQLQSVLAESLVERFNEDWWRNPHAGPWIVSELFARGQRELAEEQALRVSAKGLGFSPLVRAIETMLT